MLRLPGVLYTQDWEILVSSVGDHPVGRLAGYTGDGAQLRRHAKLGCENFLLPQAEYDCRVG